MDADPEVGLSALKRRDDLTKESVAEVTDLRMQGPQQEECYGFRTGREEATLVIGKFLGAVATPEQNGANPKPESAANDPGAEAR